MVAQMSSRAQAFLERNWTLFEDENTNHQRKLRASQGTGALVAIGDELRHHAARLRPSWPEPAARSEDEAHHLRLIAILDRVDRQRP
jgi:hypothetical protein